MMASQFFGSDRPAALRGGVGAVSVPLFSDGAGMRGQFSHGNLLRDIEAMRGKGGSFLECSCRWGCASDFELQRAARRKTAQQEVARTGQPDALVRERFLLARQQSRHQNTLPWSIPVAPSVSCGAQCKRAFYACQSDYDARGIHAMASSLAILGLMQDTKGARHGGTDEREFRCAGDQCGRNGAG